ncbi:hypothetical protein QFC24_005492 [Naganishia onofrii]|uniref:Uncharacterized protein n=1 Tax=Naganishia onofrii TaxID=1851511 RepID=A0ACC2X805_9TREE|nr:hypothetical protein QFC24_005492 [Naganishia onofrii]
MFCLGPLQQADVLKGSMAACPSMALKIYTEGGEDPVMQPQNSFRKIEATDKKAKNWIKKMVKRSNLDDDMRQVSLPCSSESTAD